MQVKDHSQVRDLLADNHLPTDRVNAGNIIMLVAEQGGRIIGCGGIDPVGGSGVLQSLVVGRENRSRGCGSLLVDRLISVAALHALRELFLLTVSGRDFFRKLALPTKRFTPWKDTVTVMINGKSIQTLSNETHLLYHSLHGAKHVWERLEWIVDIDRFIRAVPDIDWDKTLKMAKDMGAEKMFFSGIVLAQKYFHTPLPKHILVRCQSLKLEPFISYVESEFSSDDPSAEDSLAKLSKVMGLRDNFYYKALTLLEFMFRPGINERRMVILPDSLFWLYWLLRPVGMTYRFIFCRTMKLCKTDTEA